MIPPNVENRMIELLADRALGSLSHEYPELDTDVLDMAAAAVDLAYEAAPFEPLPAALASRVEEALAAERRQATVVDPRPAAIESSRRTMPLAPASPPVASSVAPASPSPSGSPSPAEASSPAGRGPAAARARARWSPLAYVGWAAAAVFFLVSAGLFRAAHPPTMPLANERARLMAEEGTLQTSFAALKDAAAAGAQGDVVWSTREQRGFMRFRGLAANPRDASGWVYQLWIFDANQDERFPIDGGVFDIDPQTGDVLVPIQAKLRVIKPQAFVITIEKPGGVVVSKRERVAMAAKI
jgi:hypothetical protein